MAVLQRFYCIQYSIIVSLVFHIFYDPISHQHSPMNQLVRFWPFHLMWLPFQLDLEVETPTQFIEQARGILTQQNKLENYAHVLHGEIERLAEENRRLVRPEFFD